MCGWHALSPARLTWSADNPSRSAPDPRPVSGGAVRGRASLAASRVSVAAAPVADVSAGGQFFVAPVDVSQVLSFEEWCAYVREETRRLGAAGQSTEDRLATLANEILGALEALGAPPDVSRSLAAELAGRPRQGATPLATPLATQLARAESLAAAVRYLPSTGAAMVARLLTALQQPVDTRA